MPERNEPEHTPIEGVRIIGAREARDAAGDDSAVSDESSGPDDSGDATAAPRRPTRYPDRGPSWTAADADDAADADADADDGDDGDEEVADEAALGDEPVSEEVDAVVVDAEVVDGEVADADGGEGGPTTAELPHWTEPPTGRLGLTPAHDDDDLDAWAVLSGSQPRFRSEESDWADADFADDTLTGDNASLGGLAEAAGPGEEEVDDDEVFAAEIRARRRGGSRSRPTPTERPRRSVRAAAATEPPGGRDLPTAVATAGVMIVLAVIAFSAGTRWTAYLAALIVGVAALELANGLRAAGRRPAVPFALVGSGGLVVAAYHYGPSAYPVVLGLTLVFSLLWFLWGVGPGRPVDGASATVFTVGYVGVLGGFAGLMLQSPDGVGLILGTVICTFVYDALGFFVGSQFGTSRIAPRVSPNKTLEGTLAGMTGSVVAGVLVVGAIAPWDTASGLTLGVLVAVAAFLGDLCESLVKRDLGFKDFGSLLPGHGGFLDRFDGLLFALPVAYYLAVHLA